MITVTVDGVTVRWSVGSVSGECPTEVGAWRKAAQVLLRQTETLVWEKRSYGAMCCADKAWLKVAHKRWSVLWDGGVSRTHGTAESLDDAKRLAEDAYRSGK